MKHPEQRQISSTSFEQFLDEHAVSRWTGRSVKSLRRDRLHGKGISYHKNGALVRYDPQDVREYLARNRRAVEV